MKTILLLWALTVSALSAEENSVYELGPPVPKSGASLKPHERVDELVFSRQDELGIKRANLCSDAVFVRRAFLAVIGTLPTAAEARAFIQDPDSANKRRLLIDRLLLRAEFADYWAMKWSDILRIKAEFPVNL